MKYLVAFAALFLLASLATSVAPEIRPLGTSPDLLLIFAACWTAIRGQEDSLVVVPLAGLFRDIAGSDPIGTSVLGLLPIVLLWTLKDRAAIEAKFLPALVLVGMGSLIYGLVTMLVLSATGQEVPFFTGMLRVVLPSTFVNLLFAPLLYFPMHWINPAPAPGLPGFGKGSTV